VRGEVRVEVLTDVPERRFAVGSTLFVGRRGEGSPRSVVVLSARPHHDHLLVRLDLTHDRDSAGLLAGQYLYVPTSDAAEIDPDSYYEHQLVGLTVVTVDGTVVGRVVELLETGSAEVLRVRAPGGDEHLVPLISDVIADIDLAASRITITPLPGLLD